MKRDKTQKLWSKAKKIIPGGNMMLSKKPDLFLPEKWPAYFSKTKGCKVWDLDKKVYTDMSLMGVGTNILGYANQKIDNEVLAVNVSDQYDKISKLFRESRMQKNLSIQELSLKTKIPENILISIEDNIEKTRPENPFLRSILFKLEECLSLKRNTFVGLLKKDKKNSRKDKRKFIISKLDFLNTWEGVFLYFLILVLSLFILKRYFLFSQTVIEIQNVEEKINQN